MPNKVRDSRQTEILGAALTEISVNGVEALTMSRIASRTGLSRTAIYQYFSSREHVLAELLINDLADLANALDAEISDVEDPIARIRAWIRISLTHIAKGDHNVIREISEVSLPDDLRGTVKALHGQFMLSLFSPVSELGISSTDSACHLIYSAVQAAAKRVEAGNDFATEVAEAEAFVISGVLGMKRSQPNN